MPVQSAYTAVPNSRSAVAHTITANRVPPSCSAAACIDSSFVIAITYSKVTFCLRNAAVAIGCSMLLAMAQRLGCWRNQRSRFEPFILVNVAVDTAVHFNPLSNPLAAAVYVSVRRMRKPQGDQVILHSADLNALMTVLIRIVHASSIDKCGSIRPASDG